MKNRVFILFSPCSYVLDLIESEREPALLLEFFIPPFYHQQPSGHLERHKTGPATGVKPADRTATGVERDPSQFILSEAEGLKVTG